MVYKCFKLIVNKYESKIIEIGKNIFLCKYKYSVWVGIIYCILYWMGKRNSISSIGKRIVLKLNSIWLLF